MAGCALPLFSSIGFLVVLSASLLKQQVAGAGDSSTLTFTPINEPLAIKYIDQSCDAENLTSFYSTVRNAHLAGRMVPLWENPGGPSSDSNTPGMVDYWPDKPSKTFLPSYGALIPDLSRYGFPSSYKWCIYLYSKNEDIHGCARDNVTWGSPAFERLGILDKFCAVNVQDEIGFHVPIIALNVSKIHLQSYVHGNDLWHNAMIVYTADWNRTDVPSVSVFIMVNTARSRIQYIRDFPAQENAFLVAGEEKHFLCIAYGGFRSLASGWLFGNNFSAPVPYDRVECNDYINRSSNCAAVSVKEEFFGVENCVQYNPDVFSFGTTTHNLVFWNASAEDTGLYTCYARYRRPEDHRGHNQTLYIYVVFIEVPHSDYKFMMNSDDHLKFMAKAPKNSTLTLWQNGKRLRNFGDDETSSCDDVPIVHQTSSSIDDFYSLYTAEIKICNVSEKSSGTYECQVHYFVESEEHLVKYKQAFTVKQDEKLGSSVINDQRVLPISLGVVGGCTVLIAVAVGLLAFIGIFARRRMRYQTAHLKTPVPITITGDIDKNKAFIPTCSESSSDPKEFLRENMDFHEQIGKGRFGKVMKASAYCIVPQMPSVNMVAVKTANSKTAHSRKMMLAELDIMKQLEAHKNICNLLAFCTLDDPVLIIMEYACHGNLKQHLQLCSQAVQQSKKPLVVTSSDGYLNVMDNDKMQAKTPGLITESLVKQYAYQIASGLEHLVSMNIVHRDLAARNILISEDFILKIGDFGMATTLSDNEGYQKIIDHTEVIAVKWAALETLENKGYFFKSDVWSFGVIVWEIASYGEEPFKEVTVGLSLDKFIEHLRSGHRLPQPPGLNDQIYNMLTKCWAKEVEDRPSAVLLKQFFQE